jgi:small-conductance mechanosensitive channel
MSVEFREIWDFVLYSTGDGQPLTVGNVAAVLLLLVGGYLASRFIGHLLGQRLAKTRIGPDVAFTIQRIVFLSLLVLVVLTALNLLGVPLTAFAFATGAIAIGVGFGAQNIINNFISGWILMAERPIRIADFIEIDGTNGVVELIGNRSTRIRRTDGVHLLVPNSRLLEQTVVNWTLVDREIRSSVKVGVAYGSPVKQVAELIMQAVNAQPEVKGEPSPSVVFDDFGDNALIFETYFWCDVGGEKFLREIRSEIRFRISALFEENGITIAFPQRDVHLDSNRPLDIRLLSKNDEER